MSLTKKVIFEMRGKKMTVTSLLVFVYIRQGVTAPRLVDLTIHLYDKVRHVAEVSLNAVPEHNAYNCLQAKLDKRVTATHCYVTINMLSGITELGEVYAIGSMGADT